jgi:hypothetical protein
MKNGPASTEGNANGSLSWVLAPARPRAGSTASNLAVLLNFPGSPSFLRRPAVRLWPFRCSRRGSPATSGLVRELNLGVLAHGSRPREISVLECAWASPSAPYQRQQGQVELMRGTIIVLLKDGAPQGPSLRLTPLDGGDATRCPNSRKKPWQNYCLSGPSSFLISYIREC